MNNTTTTATHDGHRTATLRIPAQRALTDRWLAADAFDAAGRLGASFTVEVWSRETIITIVGQAWRPGAENYTTLPFPGGTYVIGTLPPE